MLDDFRVPGGFMDGNGDYITEEEAQAESDYLDELIGRGKGDFDMPPRIRYIGEDKAVVHRDYAVTGRGEGYPWNADNMDYDPRIDEDQEDNHE